jgi:hypothetical protein
LQLAAVQARCAPEHCAHYPGEGKQLTGGRDFGSADRRVPIEARPISPLTPLIRTIAASPTSILASRDWDRRVGFVRRPPMSSVAPMADFRLMRISSGVRSHHSFPATGRPSCAHSDLHWQQAQEGESPVGYESSA